MKTVKTFAAILFMTGFLTTAAFAQDSKMDKKMDKMESKMEKKMASQLIKLIIFTYQVLVREVH